MQGTGRIRTTRWIEVASADGTVGWVKANSVALKPGGPATLQVVGVRQDDTLNVRSGPGARNKVVGTLAPGASDVTATGLAADVDDDRWLQVKHGSTVGWVHSNYVRDISSGFESTDDEGGPEMDPMSHGDFGDLED